MGRFSQRSHQLNSTHFYLCLKQKHQLAAIHELSPKIHMVCFICMMHCWKAQLGNVEMLGQVLSQMPFSTLFKPLKPVHCKNVMVHRTTLNQICWNPTTGEQTNPHSQWPATNYSLKQFKSQMCKWLWEISNWLQKVSLSFVFFLNKLFGLA